MIAGTRRAQPGRRRSPGARSPRAGVAGANHDGARAVGPGDPATRLVLGSLALAATTVLARRPGVSRREARLFRLVNGLPDGLAVPAWGVMQLGNLGAAPASALVASLAGEKVLARRLLAGGTASWALSKAVKRGVARPRPARLVAGTRQRGREQSGFGYLSGHAAVSVALGTAVWPWAGWRGRVAVAAAMPVVGLCRLYVGAHLPLDVLGGAALGVIVDAVLALDGRRSPGPPGGAAPRQPKVVARDP